MTDRRLSSLSPKSKKWLSGAILLAGVVLFLWVPVKNMLDVKAVQNAVQRDWEISFGYSDGTDVPRYFPMRIDSEVMDFFHLRFANAEGQDPKTWNRNIVYHERFRAFFRGWIDEVHVYDFEGFRGDLGAALARFPRLRRVTADAFAPDLPTETEWKSFCDRLRKLPHLEQLEISGDQLTDEAIKPLAGHPRLTEVTVLGRRLTDACAKTFAAMPRFSKLHIEGQTYPGEVWLSEERKSAMRASLPGVTVELPD